MVLVCLLVPGVGVIASEISGESLGREMVRIYSGGMRDESEIRGHRRTYMGRCLER